MTTRKSREEVLAERDAKYKKNLMSIEEFLEQRLRFFMSIWAETGVGKSKFILGAPKPIWFLSYEIEGPYWAVKTAYDASEIEIEDVYIDEVIKNALDVDDIPSVRTLDQESDIWNYTQDAIESICRIARKESLGGTIAIDTQSTLNSTVQEVEMEEIIAKRKAQGKDEPYQFDYGVPNKAFKRLLDHVRQTTDLNMIVTGKSTDIRNSKGETTGRFKYAGSSRVIEWVDVHGRLEFEQARFNSKGEVLEKSSSWFTIEKCRIDRQKVGLEIDNPTFETVMQAINGKSA